MRQCDGCTACCTALAVAELNKPRYQRCAHLGDTGGCNNYAQRPGACRDYRCLWLEGHLTENDRPDRLGVIFTATADPDHPEEGTLPMLIEVTPGSLDAANVQAAIRTMSAQRPVVLLRAAGRQILGRATAPVTLTLAGHPVAA